MARPVGRVRTGLGATCYNSIRLQERHSTYAAMGPLLNAPTPHPPGLHAADLDLVLRTRGIRNIVLAGITTDVCVHTTMRDANDMGYECLLLTDCTGATDHNNHLAAIEMVKKQVGSWALRGHLN
jgi:nicotinamidase-related amidase